MTNTQKVHQAIADHQRLLPEEIMAKCDMTSTQVYNALDMLRKKRVIRSERIAGTTKFVYVLNATQH